MSLRVIQPGMFTTVQDLGRPGLQRDGVPVSGAMDTFALRAANLLTGNAAGDAGLEMTLTGATLEFNGGALIALCGAPVDAWAADVQVPLWHPVWIPRGATLTCGPVLTGCRTYLGIAGGVVEPVILGGRSTFTRGGFGGHAGRHLMAGDELPVGTLSPLSVRIAAAVAGDGHLPRAAHWGIGPSMRPGYSREPVIRLLQGAHSASLTAVSRDRLFREPFRVSTQSDRMGYRLEGVTLELTAPLDLLSEAVVFGTMQLPPSGEPIVLMADRQTTGGYPRIGEVVSVDLPLMAQLKPGDQVGFRPVSLVDAQRLYLERERELAQAAREILFRHS